MKRLLFALMVFMLLVFPVSAYIHTFRAPSGKALESIIITSTGDTTATIDLLMANNATIQGSWYYKTTPFFVLPMNAEVSIGGDTKTFTYLLPGTLTTVIWSTGNVSNAMKMRMGIGQTLGYYNAVVEADMPRAPLIGYTITSDKPVVEDYVLIPYAAADKAASPEAGEDIITKLKKYFDAFYTIISALIYWVNFLFVENLIMIVVLYITGTMAYAINTSSNIFAFYKTWFRQQVAFYHFVATVVSLIISTIAAIIQSFKPV
jgi:hypothetical protein